MNPSAIAVVIAAILGAGGVGSFLGAKAQNRRTLAQARHFDAQASVDIGSTWQLMWETQHKDNNELRDRVAKVEARAEQCEKREQDYLDRIARLEAGGRDAEEMTVQLIRREIAKREGS